MKKILFCAIALLGISAATYAQGNFRLIKKGGKATGFSHVEQKTDAKGNTEITCFGSGYDKAEFVAPPDYKAKVDLNKIIKFVDEQVKGGKLSGTAVVEGMQAKWKGSDPYNYILSATNNAGNRKK